MDGQRNAFTSPAQFLPFIPAQSPARHLTSFSSYFLLDTPLSSSPVLLDTQALPTRHSVTSRIRLISCFYNHLTFSTRHLNRTLENGTF
jgi:hypothetical protein